MKQLSTVLASYKLYALVFATMIAVLLIRIPFGTFNTSPTIDSIGHFVLPATAAPLLAMVLQATKFAPKLRTSALLLAIILLGVTSEALWEIFEFCIDQLLGFSWQPNNTDTMLDIILAVAGTIVGGLLFIRIYKK
jgi:hypothetical protein